MDTFSGKTVLVTGASGLIGSHIVDAFMAMGDVRVIALGRSEEKLRALFAAYLPRPEFSLLVRDAAAPLPREAGPVSYIFHAAGPTEGRIIAGRPLDVIAPNLLGTRNCLDFLRLQEETAGLRGRLVLFSSVTVYANPTGADLTVREEDTGAAEPLESWRAPYSHSKRMAEVIAGAYQTQYHTDTVIARLSTVYGDTVFPADSAFFEFLRKSAAGEDLLLKDSGGPRRDNIYIQDAVAGLLCICRAGLSGQAYNISSNGELGNFAAVDEIARAFAQAAGRRGQQICVRFENGPSETRKPGLLLDNGKLKSLGWRLETSLTQGIGEALASWCGRNGPSAGRVMKEDGI